MTSILYIDGGGPVEADYIELTAASTGTNHSLAANYGGEASGRKILHAVHLVAGDGVTPTFASTPTIGGVTATVLKSTLHVEGGQFTTGVIWLGAEKDAGTSGNLVAAFNQSVSIQASTFRLINAQSLALVDEDGLDWILSTDATKSLSIDVLDRGLALAAATTEGTLNITAGVNGDYSTSLGGGGFFTIAGGHAEISGDQTGRTITIARTQASWRGAFSALSIR